MDNIEAIKTDITWIKGSLKRIEGHMEQQQKECGSTHKEVDEKLNALNVRIILLASLLSGGITGGIELLKFIIGKI